MAFSADVIQMNLTVANPENIKKTLPVKSYLPKGIQPDDVVQKGDFSISYDFEKSMYYIYQNIEMEPNEKKDLSVGFKDIWVLPLDQIQTLKNHTEKIIKALKDTEYAQASAKLGGTILGRLDKVLNENLSSLTMEDRVVVFEEDMAIFRAQKKDIGILEDMAIETGKLGAINELMGESVSTVDNLGEFQGPDSLVVRMSVTNPFSNERIVPFKYYLPAEVKPEFIKNSDGLNAGYDYRQGVYYLYNDSVSFGVKETKDFSIEIKDLWIISSEKLQVVRKRTEKLMALLSATEYIDLAKESGNNILKILADIETLQANKEQSIDNHIGTFRINLEKFKDALKDMDKLERLLIQSGGSLAKAMVDNKAPKAEGKGFKTEGSLKSELKQGVEIFHKQELSGKAPDVATTWRVIWYIMGFLGCLTVMFFILWWTEISSGNRRGYRDVQSIYSQPKTNNF